MVLVGPFGQLSFIPVTIRVCLVWQGNWSQAMFKRWLGNTVATDPIALKDT